MGKSKKAKPTGEERALAERSVREFNHYITNYRTPEHTLMREIQATEGDRAAARGSFAANVAQSASDTEAARYTSELAAGASETSGRNVFGGADVQRRAGGARGTLAAAAEQAVNDMDLEGKIKVASFGRNLADDSRLTLQNSAQRATQLALADFEASNMKTQALWEAAGTLSGAAFEKLGGVDGLRSRIQKERDLRTFNKDMARADEKFLMTQGIYKQ